MNAPFPFGFPGPTAMYLSLYVVTLALHVLFMNYALAGTLYVAVSALFRRGKTTAAPQRTNAESTAAEADDVSSRDIDGQAAGSSASTQATIVDSIVSGLPFALGLAITAGVAPLLFIQILYEKRFYTANLLLHHRWMLIVPALVAGFYLLYLLKTDAAKARPWLWRLAALGAAGCFVFVAWSWTENHLLSRDDHAWVATYASKRLIYSSTEIWPRLLMWLLGAFAALAVVVGFQLRTAEARGERVDASQVRQLARVGLAGVLLGGAAALGYTAIAKPVVRAAALSPLALPYLIITVAGGVTQLVAWLVVLRKGRLGRGLLWLAAAGLSLALLGSGAVREAARLAEVDIAALYANHARAAQAQGLWLFLLFMVVNGVLIGFAFRIARRAALQPDPPPSDDDEDDAAPSERAPDLSALQAELE